MRLLKVSPNRRYLIHDDGVPFFYLADTAWELFHRLNKQEAYFYFKDRVSKGYTVIQAVILAELDGLAMPNYDGELPLHDNDPTKPNETYFQHVDYIINMASDLGLYIALLPTWGDKWNIKWGVGPVIFNSTNAGYYGEYLGRRYRDNLIIWVLGGDRPIETLEQLQTVRKMAHGIQKGDGGRHLIAFHPPGCQSSSKWLHDEDWLDFNMAQTGHNRNGRPYTFIAEDYARHPIKPCLNGEPAYEDHPHAFKVDPVEFFLNDTDVRKELYWSLFAGAMGHTYGCHSIWQMWQEGHPPVNAVRMSWFDAMSLLGGSQMQYGRWLVESRSYLTRIPDQSMLLDPPDTPADHVQACRDIDGRYAFIYIPTGLTTKVNLSNLSGDNLCIHWYNPRTGRANCDGEITRQESYSFIPPTRGPGNDWILVLDDAAQRYAAPGIQLGRSTDADVWTNVSAD